MAFNAMDFYPVFIVEMGLFFPGIVSQRVNMTRLAVFIG